MSKPVIALPVSQHFNTVFPALADIVKVLLIQRKEFLPADLGRYPYRKVYHTNGFINQEFLAQMSAKHRVFLNDFGVSHMSFDLGPSCCDVYFHPQKDDIYWPSGSCSTLAPEEIIKIAKERITLLRKSFSGTIALENLDYHPGGAYEHVCEPDFITAALTQIDAYFTLDIGHLLVTSFNLGIDPHQYLSRLPLARVREVHLSHAEEGIDKHGLPTSYEYELLEYVLGRSRPEFIVIEYYQDPGKIVEANVKLNSFLNKRVCCEA